MKSHLGRLFAAFVLCSIPVSFASAATFFDHLTLRLADGSYEGDTDGGKRCRVNVRAVASEQVYVVSVTPEWFNSDKDDGSTQCFGAKACFAFEPEYKVLSAEGGRDFFRISVERPRGGPDSASAKEMEIKIDEVEGGLRVEVKEEIGLFNWGSTQANCTLKSNI